MIRRRPRSTELDAAMAPWLECDLCVMAAWRRHVVTGRGDVPAEVLFLGMAPGKTEDLIGEPFRGESGRHLNSLIRMAARLAGRTPSYYVANIVACRPSDGPHAPNRDPTPDECLYCRPRLADLVAIVRPKRVVCFGEVAQRESVAVCPDAIAIVHPAYLARMGAAGGSARLAAVRTLADVFRKETR